MKQTLTFDLDNLTAVLDYIENGKRVRYDVDLDGERANVIIERRELDGNGEPVNCRSALLTFAQLTDPTSHDVEWAREKAVVWAARGPWGMPLEFGQAKKAAEAARAAIPSLGGVVDEAMEESKPAQRRTPNRSAK